jgi:hypothetical protein
MPVSAPPAAGKLGEELGRLGTATGTREQLRGSTDGSGGAILGPPELRGPTYGEIGIQEKACRAK